MTVISNRIPALLLTFFVLIYFGCAGGGTAGTGGQSFTGRMITTTQQPLASVTITILESGDSGVTDANGNFLIEADTQGGDLTFEFTRSDINTSLLIPAIPANAETVDLELEYSQPENKVTPKKISVKEKPTSSSSSAHSTSTSSAGGSADSTTSGTNSEGASSASSGEVSSATTSASRSVANCRPPSGSNSDPSSDRQTARTDDSSLPECEPATSSSKSSAVSSRSESSQHSNESSSGSEESSENHSSSRSSRSSEHSESGSSSSD